MITPSAADRDVVNKVTYESYLGSSYGGISKDGKYTLMDTTNFKDSFVKDNVVYLVEFTPINESKKEAYGGLVAVGNKFYDFEIYIGNSKYSDEVFDTLFGILATLK